MGVSVDPERGSAALQRLGHVMEEIGVDGRPSELWRDAPRVRQMMGDDDISLSHRRGEELGRCRSRLRQELTNVADLGKIRNVAVERFAPFRMRIPERATDEATPVDDADGSFEYHQIDQLPLQSLSQRARGLPTTTVTLMVAQYVDEASRCDCPAEQPESVGEAVEVR